MNIPKLVYSGVGKRKTAVAYVIIKTGSDIIKINNKTVEELSSIYKEYLQIILKPITLLNPSDKYEIYISVSGGGVISKFEAIQLAISKCLAKISLENKKNLRKYSLTTTDSRIKERRKYGLKKARKAPQYSKR